ncbi:histone deacetylase complex subunit SAP130-like [Watersipora subatra]|uniref:histone deacetylase complex subunit SAP130-like n=1 Tax=Watersipora subatra TaxID=2589382 RepID=UPI00355B1362
MSSLETNTYTVKPSVQVGNPITVTKPIIASNLCIRPPSAELAHPFHQQPKKIQPFPKVAPPRDHHKAKPGVPTVFQLKSLHKPAPASVNADYNSTEATKKVQAKLDPSMGNESGRLHNSAIGSSVDPGIQHSISTPISAHLNNNIPVPVASLNASAPPRMASIITAPGMDNRMAEVRTSNNVAAPAQHALPSGPRVVSTSSSKTITGGVPVPGHLKQQVSHRGTTFGTRTTVIQSAHGVKGPQQQIVRSVSSQMRTVTTTHRPTNPPIAPAATHQSQNPTTVQITIHQPKHTLSSPSAGTERPSTNTPQSSPSTHYGNAHTQVPACGAQPGPQRVVNSQSSTGGIQQNRTTVPIGTPEQNRLSTGPNSNFALRKSGRPPGPMQHDYMTSVRKPGPTDFTPLPSRSGVSMHAAADHKPLMTSGFYSTATATTSSVGGNFHPTTISNLDQHQGVFKTHNYNIPLSHIPSSAVPTIISTPGRSGSSGSSTVIMADNPPQDSTGSAHTLSRPGVSPSILRKRPHDSSNAVVVKKLPGDRLAGYSERALNSQPLSPAKHQISNVPVEKDTASQSSTDTAMSSESPVRPTIKPEPVEAIENGERDVQAVDVSPRKKPRKQLLNTAAELKDRHDSSTEEETETKADISLLPMTDDYKLDVDELKSSSIKEEFVDREGVRWVKMRKRYNNLLMKTFECPWDSTSSHFHSHADVKVKEERRPVVSELTSQRGIKQKASGWKFYHLSSQLQEMIDIEHRLCERMNKLQKLLPGKVKDKHPDLLQLNELAQANKQRCSLTKDQLLEAKSSMFSILENHKPKIMEIIQKNHSKRLVKKKERS